MSKRGNDLSQLTKFDYEEAMKKGAVSGDFVKASAEVLGRRKILRTGSKWKQAKGTASSAPTTTPMPSTATPANPFSNFSFTKASNPAPALGGPTTAPTGKPTFAMPSLPSYSASAAPSLSPMKSAESDELQTIVTRFKEVVKEADPRDDMYMVMSKVMNTIVSLKSKSKTSSPADASKETSASDSSSSKPLFPSVTNSPAPVSFSFGSVAGATSSTNTFSFAKPASAAAPAPASSTGFSFSMGSNSTLAPAPAAAAPVPSTTSIIETNEAPKAEEANMESADDDWTLVRNTRAKVYHHRDKAGAKKFAFGGLKLQELKEDPKIRRMVMRDPAGNVLLNVAISSDMTFKKSKAEQAKGRPPTCRVQFYGIRDPAIGAEMLTLVCKEDELDALYNQLTNWSS